MTQDRLLGDTTITSETLSQILSTLDNSSPEVLDQIAERLKNIALAPALRIIKTLRMLVQLKMNLTTYCSSQGIDIMADEPVANEIRQEIQSAYLDLEDAVIELRMHISGPLTSETDDKTI